uniref:Contactin associated protein-like 5a n=1 Tax=Periophthalmus magnuspinnatus TaxID=409849 RepID=A0A3B3ZSN5_9GOBI
MISHALFCVLVTDSCSSPLISSLPQSSFQSSSQSSYSYGAQQAKINRRDGAGGWSPMVTDREPWLQLDLRERMEVTAVSTQGRANSQDWVSRYMLLYSDTGQAWKQYRQEDGTFEGNTNAEGVVQNRLSQPVRTRFLRLVPVDWNRSGWIGLRLEVYGCSYKSDVADFDGRSALLYRFNQKSMSTVKDVISLRFKSRQAEGVLLHGEGQRGDYITLELHRGKLALYLNLGQLRLSSGRVAVTVGSLLDDQHWHTVVMERFNRQVNLTVDAHSQHFTTRGQGDSLEVDYELSFGGIPLPGKPGTFLRKNFHGCIENLYYNGINIIDLAKRRKPQIYSVVRRKTPSYPSSPSTSSSTMGGFSVRFQFRTWNQEGFLLGARLSPEPHKLELSISNSRLVLSLHSAGHKAQATAGTRCPVSGCRNPTISFQGCMRLISINGQPISLQHVQQGLLGNYNELLFDTCSIRDRCLPNLCEHGGRCVQTWSSFSCDCSGTGYSGATCHNSIYEPSCEAYKLMGSSSGFYSIDPDGSGPLGPTQVYCNMTDERVWTVITHNTTEPVRVQGSSVLQPHIMDLNYSASSDQLRAIVAGSEHCQQEVVYSCRKSRLFNTKDGRPLSYWLDQSGERRSYWGGFLPGVQQCSCSLEENCVDMNYFCNCDADTDTWYSSTYRLGVSCLNNCLVLHSLSTESLWNSASFYQDSSYLHFPPLHSELSTDVSFFFKTSSSSGVFLENLGLSHFIRIELSSPSVITFSFDVGNGPMVLTVKSHLPLNDRQWHHVRAERSVKEALLQVDQLPLRFLQAPSDGHTRLRLTSQLFVGGTSSRQRGFLGCIRTLVINGVTFDLEERAKLAPGVSPGCPGYCSGSSSLCHNRGRCIEKSSGFACDCSQSAYGGPSCKEEVSVSFERESSVTFTFQEPFSVMQNRSSQASVWREREREREGSRAREDMAFSFVTSHSPAMLLSVSTFSQQYIAVILARNGSLQIWYQLQSDRAPDVFSPVVHSLSDGRLHRIRLHREGRDLYVQVRKYRLSSASELVLIRSLTLGKVVRTEGFPEEVVQAGARGFVGCLSSVQFNHVAPLKAALLNRGSSLVTIRGPVVQSNCGALADTLSSHNLLGKTLTFLLCFFTVFIYLFIYLSIYPFIYLSIYVFIYLCIYLFIYLFIYLCIHYVIYLFIHLSIYLFIHLFIYLSIYLFILSIAGWHTPSTGVSNQASS